jgi:ribonuclease VapC
MIVDSSVVVAIVCREPGFEELVAKLQTADTVGLGAPTAIEAGMVLQARLGIDGRAVLERFVRDFEVEVLPFGDDHWREAVDAFRRFGNGRHPAALNFGDCMSYATAAVSARPLLFVGHDFSQTDIAPA